MKRLDARYLDDSQFRMLVKTFEQLFLTMQFTPSEVREAAMLAQMNYEMMHPRKTYFSEELMREIEFRTKPKPEGGGE